MHASVMLNDLYTLFPIITLHYHPCFNQRQHWGSERLGDLSRSVMRTQRGLLTSFQTILPAPCQPLVSPQHAYLRILEFASTFGVNYSKCIVRTEEEKLDADLQEKFLLTCGQIDQMRFWWLRVKLVFPLIGYFEISRSPKKRPWVSQWPNFRTLKVILGWS